MGERMQHVQKEEHNEPHDLSNQKNPQYPAEIAE